VANSRKHLLKETLQHFGKLLLALPTVGFV
jgi:hypothetical protein